ncbi:Hint domain-containing protein [Paracoccus ravus]|uniref:Hint domain-containing protein n=1 Tax=Paracoccus ravus TaxID=2447760 RepID=UPI001FD6AF1C|nr:Hint domain-containing protein [Paracoccus ravus]
MAIYSFDALPPSAFTSGKLSEWQTSYQPFHDSYISPSGSGWQYANGFFTYSRDLLVSVTVDDTDKNGMTLDDYDHGETTQRLVSSFLGYPAGTVIEDEFEIALRATVDGESREYRLVALGVNDGKIAGYTFQGEWPPEGVALYPNYTGTGDSDYQEMPQPVAPSLPAPCFARGVMIATPRGEVAIENLRAGDLVLTQDHGLQAIRWIGSVQIGAADLRAMPNMQPIRIAAGALGLNSPARDLVVSPQHRILLRSRLAQKLFGACEVLVAAKQLLALGGVTIATDIPEVEYFHLLFDRHEIVTSNGAATESLYPGGAALRAVGPAALAEIHALFPALREPGFLPQAARMILAGRHGRNLAARHARRAEPLLA